MARKRKGMKRVKVYISLEGKFPITSIIAFCTKQFMRKRENEIIIFVCVF